MSRKNMALILSIFLFMGLLFSVDYFERQGSYDYDESCQIYTVHGSVISNVTVQKSVKKQDLLYVFFLFSGMGMLLQNMKKCLSGMKEPIVMFYSLKEIQVSQEIDGKK